MRNRKKNLPQSTTALYTCLAGARPGLRDFVDIGLGGEMSGQWMAGRKTTIPARRHYLLSCRKAKVSEARNDIIAKLYCLLIDKTIPSAKSDHTAIVFQILICA